MIAAGMGVAALSAALAGCGSGPSAAPSTSTSTSTSATTAPVDDTVATDQAVADVNLVLDFQKASLPWRQKLADVEDGSKVAKALHTELRAIAGAGVVGVSVQGARVLGPAGCRTAGVSSPCVEVRYAVVDGRGRGAPATQRAYVVRHGNRWLLARQSACDLPQPVAGGTRLAQPRRAAC